MLTIILTLAAAVPQATPAAAPRTLQARFDAANTATVERRCADAIALYDGVERAPAIVRNRLAVATIAVRKGGCLMRLGRGAEGEAAIRAGLPMLEGAAAEFADDIRDARLLLARAAQGRFDYDATIVEAEKSLAAATGPGRLLPLLTLSAVTMFDGDARALRYAEEARAILTAQPAPSPKDVAAVQTQYARVLLNQGRFAEAYAMLKDSLAKQGGLKSFVNLADVATRSDLAIAALLTGDKDAARRYLAYTGAGRISQAPFGRATAMTAPSCDPAIGLKPSDVAVVEFSLGQDGQVLTASPVYVTGTRAAALAFARAVRDWSWTADEAKAIPPFYRALTRVEVRCSTAADVPDLARPLNEAAAAWLAAGDASTDNGTSWAAAAPAQRAALANAAPGSRAELAALTTLASNPSLALEERTSLSDRATVQPCWPAGSPHRRPSWSRSL